MNISAQLSTGMTFQFIDNAAIDQATRKRIRSHAATGKNVGKKLTRSSRKHAFIAKPSPFQPSKARTRASRLFEEEDEVPEIERQISDGMSFPVPISAKSRSMARKAFQFLSGPRQPPKLAGTVEPVDSRGSIWVQYMLTDEAYFHSSMALTITILNRLTTQPEDAAEVMGHLSQAFRVINDRICHDDEVSDRTMASVVGMSQYERINAQYKRGYVHVQGLRQMTELRGGIARLGKVMPELAVKILRSDLEYALQLGSETLFSIEDVVPGRVELLECDSYSQKENYQDHPSDNGSEHPTLLRSGVWDLFTDTKHIAALLNEASSGRHPTVKSSWLHQTIIQLGYRLISINNIAGDRLRNGFDILVHAGLAAFISTILVGLDYRIADNLLLADLARKCATTSDMKEKGHGEFLLWLLFMGNVSLFKEHDDLWLIGRTRRILNTLHVHTWNEVRQILIRYPWVEVFHNKSGQMLWCKVTAGLNRFP